MKKIYIYLLSILTIFFQSCIKEIEMHTWPVQPVLVVNSLITPDSVFSCTLFKTSSLPDTNLYTVNQAEINIYNKPNGTLVCQLENTDDGQYRSNLKPTVGRSYKLTVNAKGFSPLSATTYVPDKASVDSVYVNYNVGKEMVDGENDFFSEVHFTIKDEDSNTNFFDVFLLASDTSYYEYYDTNGNSFVNFDSLVISSSNSISGLIFTNTDEVLNEEDLWSYSPTSFLFSDKLFHQSEHQFNIRIMYNYGWYSSYILFLSVSEEYYKYRKSWFVHYYNQAQKKYLNQIDVLKMDFSTHPVEMYTNVKGGYGIFAGYNASLLFSECNPIFHEIYDNNIFISKVGTIHFNRTKPCNEH